MRGGGSWGDGVQLLEAGLGAAGGDVGQEFLVGGFGGSGIGGVVAPLGEDAVGVVAVDVAGVDLHQGIGDPVAGLGGAVGAVGEIALAVLDVDDVDA